MTKTTPLARQGSSRWEWFPPPYDMFDDLGLFGAIRSRRICAYLIDIVIILLLATALWIVGSVFVVISFGTLAPLLALAGALLPLAYHTWMIGGRGQATLGMRAMGLRAYTWHGHPPSYAQAAIVTAVFYGSMTLTSGLILLVAVFNPRGRLLHDYICGMVFVREAEFNVPPRV